MSEKHTFRKVERYNIMCCACGSGFRVHPSEGDGAAPSKELHCPACGHAAECDWLDEKKSRIEGHSIRAERNRLARLIADSASSDDEISSAVVFAYKKLTAELQRAHNEKQGESS